MAKQIRLINRRLGRYKRLYKKGNGQFEDAMNYSEECKFDDAYSAADDGYTYAKRGYNSDDYDEMKDTPGKPKSKQVMP